jgi:hypothetical protein
VSNDLELNGRRALVTKSDGHLLEIKTGGLDARITQRPN